ncbi:MAG: hypothetical protein KAS47_03085 [Candidatus Heimdallarchaeota archaeon]|nr:hypothetical protein [Candidatus Heimdallarchaeota archaeon]
MFILICGISVFDINDYIGMNLAFFGSGSDWWNVFAFWAYCFVVVGLLQLVKGIIVQEKG